MDNEKAMKRNIIFAVLLLFVVIACSKIALPVEKKDCKKWGDEIKDSIDKLNYCSKDNDCLAIMTGFCPFGCYWLVNKKADLSGTKKQIEDFEAQGCGGCMYKCGAISKNAAKCKKKKCVIEHKTK